jgi:predicted DCC family thiol-disulfide oxidoreductase YuxK
VARPGPLAIGVLLLLCAAPPPAPYGSLAARGRSDPGGSWRLPQPVHAAAWGLLCLFYLSSGLGMLVSGQYSLALPELAFPPLALLRRFRPWLWVLMLALQVALLAFSGAWSLLPPLVFLPFFALDPGWVRPAPPPTPERLFYDGTCGLCHRAVRFLLAEDQGGQAFRYAPLGGETFRGAVPEMARVSLPDSLVLQSAEGALFVRSAGALRALARLGGLWRLIAAAARLIPAPLRDPASDLIARVRYRLFARPAEACPVVPRHLRARFDP